MIRARDLVSFIQTLLVEAFMSCLYLPVISYLPILYVLAGLIGSFGFDWHAGNIPAAAHLRTIIVSNTPFPAIR